MALLLLPAAAALRSIQQQQCCQHQHQYFLWIPRRPPLVVKALPREISFAPSLLTCNSNSQQNSAQCDVSEFRDEISVEEKRRMWFDIMEDGPVVNVQSEDGSALSSALKKYLFLDSDGRSKWVTRRNAVLLVQNSGNVTKALESVGDKMETADMNLLVRRFINAGKWDNARQLVSWMEKEKRVTNGTYSVYISMLGRNGAHFKALAIYNSLSKEHRLDSFVGNAILSALVNNWKVMKAFSLFSSMKEDGFVPNAITYSTILSACLKLANGYEVSKRILKEMKDREMKPDIYAYGSLLRVYCAHRRAKEAQALVEEMRCQGVTLTVFHYSYLLNLYAKVNKPSKADEILRQMGEEGLQPNEIVYRSLLRLYGRNGRVEDAKRVFDEIRQTKFALDMAIYTAMIEAYVTSRQVYEAHELLLEMRRNGIRPGSNAYRLLIAGYGEMKDLDMINKLILESHDRKKGIGDVRMYNSFLKAYSQVRCDNGITNTLERMDSEGIRPDRGSFNILIEHLCLQGMYALALRTFRDMKSRKLKPNMGTYSRLLNGLTNPLLETTEMSTVTQLISVAEKAKQREVNLLDAAYQIYREMQARKVYCSHYVFERYIQANAVYRNWPLVMEALGSLEKAGYIPTKELCEFLLVQACNDSHYGSMKEILAEADKRGYELSKEVLDKAKDIFNELDQLNGALGSF